MDPGRPARLPSVHGPAPRSARMPPPGGAKRASGNAGMGSSRRQIHAPAACAIFSFVARSFAGMKALTTCSGRGWPPASSSSALGKAAAVRAS